MSFRHTFTATGPAIPHWPSVLQTIRQVDATAGLMPDGLSADIDKATTWTAQQVTQVQTVIDTAPRDTPQVEAQYQADTISVFDKALVLALIDQFNVLRALHSLPAITPAQAIAAIRTKAGTL